MPLRMDFDRHSSNALILRGIVGAFLGTIPGAIYILWNANKMQSGDPFLIALLQIGCISSVLIGVGSGATAFLVAAIRSRGTGPGKVPYLKESVTPEPLPVVPGSSQREQEAPVYPAIPLNGSAGKRHAHEQG